MRPEGWRAVLFRGVKPQQADAVADGGGIAADRHVGTMRQHAQDVQAGSRKRTAGLSLTKDPFVAARYAASSRGRPLCIDEGALRHPRDAIPSADLRQSIQNAGGTPREVEGAGHGTVDLSTEAGQNALGAAGADLRTRGYARSDAEVRHGGGISAQAVRREGGLPVTVAAEVAAAGDLRVVKAGYELTTCRRRRATR